ncbi:MAG TPA: nuclease-related domain-containing protein [Anaerolineaceae bacterium]|nr:nuclease-related domain-containing protein [Anaerolineaceae bacterium]HOH18763.1 nuclease-related domain-containing protein [Anaerolineaceae bacterium]HPA34113.1 nuclease-related domain-containing protein [Anaerolineaceae bacterium]HQH35616.1 nuclease-related domain-containing protein [Anaerolineaceae bacterium]HQO96480.1 nuclease-related domain-containing protein [Anaerolineaceae bacterium]
MRIVINEQKINRNRKIGQVLTIASLVILGIGLFVSFSKPELFYVTLGSLIIGFILSQFGIYYGNRWGRSPRPDEEISSALKGLDDRYSLYHYTTDVPHLLVGPAGIWVISPYNQNGDISYNAEKQRWVQKGGNWYMKTFAQEGLGRPDLDAKDLLSTSEKYFRKVLKDDAPVPPIQVVMVFTHKKVSVSALNAPIPTMEIAKFKDFIRKQSKENSLPLSEINRLQDALPD